MRLMASSTLMGADVLLRASVSFAVFSASLIGLLLVSCSTSRFLPDRALLKALSNAFSAILTSVVGCLQVARYEQRGPRYIRATPSPFRSGSNPFRRGTIKQTSVLSIFRSWARQFYVHHARPECNSFEKTCDHLGLKSFGPLSQHNLVQELGIERLWTRSESNVQQSDRWLMR